MPIDYDSHSVVAVIPVYDEVGRIGKVISRFSRRFVDEICLVVDSPSDTMRNEVEHSAKAVDVPLHVIENHRRRGIGYAIRLGIRYALENRFDIVVVLAGNNKDDPREIPRFLDAIIHHDYDYVQGSRFLPGGLKEKTPLLRGIFIRMYPFLWSVLTKVLCTDVTNGFRAYKTQIFRDKRINIWQDWLDGYELEYYIHYKVLTLSYGTREVLPSKIYPYRNKGGYSKINPFRDFWNILRPLFYLSLGVRK
jgi:dolichol-phosphate mannosyltransferase